MRRRFMNRKDNKKHLSFIALEDGMSITFTFNGTAYYSVNNEEWKRMESGVSTEEVKAGSIIYVKGNTNSPSFEISKKCKLSGFCASILYGDKVSKDSVAYENCFRDLFKDCTTIVEVDNILPATTLASSCYYGMFDGCTSLVNAPELPATTLASDCYGKMFDGCTSLVNAPELPATTLERFCYRYMFSGCINLNYIKMLATDISASNCLYDWVYGVSPTGAFVKHPDMENLPTGNSGIPEGWTVINDGEENADGFGVQFPIHFEFDSCETIPNLNITSCYRKGDDLGINLYNYIVFIIAKYGEVYPAGIFVFEETLSLLGIEIYIEGSKVVSLDHSEVGYYLNTDGDYLYTIIRSDGSLLCEQ